MGVLLLGIGNVLLKDERVGVHVVKTIEERYTFSPDVEIVDGGTLGLDLLPLFERFDKVVVVDAVNFGKEPGYIGVLEDNDIPAVLYAKLSVHHIGLADVLSAAKLLGIMPSKIYLIGIQPSTLEFNFGLEMSDVINATIDKVIDLTISKLKECNIECVLRSPQESSA